MLGAGSSKNIFLTAAAGLALLAFLVWNSGHYNSSRLTAQALPLTSKKSCPPVQKTREFNYQPYYTGPLIDGHIHMPVSSSIVSAVAKRLGSSEFKLSTFGKDMSVHDFHCLTESEGIKQVFGLFLTTKFSLSGEVKTAKKFQKEYPGKVMASFMPAPFNALRVSPKDLRKTLDKNPGLFKGLGELKIFDGTDFNNPHYTELYQIAKDYNLIVMAHPQAHDKDDIKKILKQYPEVTFYFHGGETKGPGRSMDGDRFIADILAKGYRNVYYSVNPAAIIGGFKPEHKYTDPTASEASAYLRENFDERLNESLDRWQTLVESYPNRFLFETDRQDPWNYDAELGALIEEISRAFIGRLSGEVQEKFAYQNAQKIFGR